MLVHDERTVGEGIRGSREYQGMTGFGACAIIEGFAGHEDSTEAEQHAAWQYLVDSGQAWTLQGFYGRNAQRLIETGVIEAAI